MDRTHVHTLTVDTCFRCSAAANEVLLSDSYNHKVKLVQASRGEEQGASCRTLAGSGRAGYKDGPGTSITCLDMDSSSSAACTSLHRWLLVQIS